MKLKGFLYSQPHLIPAVIAAVMLLVAFGKWPYAYYQIMRWVVCAAAVFMAYKGWTYEKAWGAFAFGFMAVMFNPLAPIYMKHETWRIIDVIAAAIFIVGAVLLCRSKTEKDKP